MPSKAAMSDMSPCDLLFFPSIPTILLYIPLYPNLPVTCIPCSQTFMIDNAIQSIQ